MKLGQKKINISDTKPEAIHEYLNIKHVFLVIGGKSNDGPR